MTLILSGTDGLSDVDGSAATPAIRGTDANTGIFFPAADTIAFSEGGVESMRITPERNVGIGVTPSATWSSSARAIQLGGFNSIFGYTNNVFRLANNAIFTASNETYGASSIGATYYQQYNGAHSWFNAASGTAGNAISWTQAMTLNSTGLGIGETSITSRLTVKDSIDLLADFNSTGTNGGYMVWRTSGTVIADIGTAQNIYGTGGSDTFGINARGARALLFGTNNTERMRIDSSGNLLVGTTSSAARITAKAATSDNSGYVTYMDDSAGTLMFYVRNDGVFLTGGKAASPYNNNVGAVRTLMVTSSGVLGYNASTRNTKTNIAPLTNVNWLFNLEPVSFNYREKDDDNNYTDVAKADVHYGLIAEDAENVNKDLCFYNSDGSLAGVNYDLLSPALLKAVQDMKAIIDTQASTITQLQADVAALKGTA